MSFSIPKKNASELILYVWKILDVQWIDVDELIFEISFKLFLFSPQKSRKLIQRAIETELLKRNPDGTISLSSTLKDRLSGWQLKRKEEIEKKLDRLEDRKSTQKAKSKDANQAFGVLLKGFLDKGTLNRAATVSDAAFDVGTFDWNQGLIKARVSGNKEDSYEIELNKKKKFLKHDCHDFKERRAPNKKFCKHLAKLFLILRGKNEEDTEKFMKSIIKELENWKFLA